MKTQLTKALALVSFLVAVSCSTAAHAQSARTMKFHIPFNSMFNKTSMPAGDYTVRILDGASAKVLLIQSDDGRVKAAAASSIAVTARESASHAKLVFNRYGDQYFLSQVWAPGQDIGRELYKSRLEREIRKGTQTAKTASPAQPATMALLARQ